MRFLKVNRKSGILTDTAFQRIKKVTDFFDALQIRHIFCEAYASRKISLRSSKSLIAQAFLMAIIQLEAGLAPSSSPAARLSFLGSMGFFDSLKKRHLNRYRFIFTFYS